MDWHERSFASLTTRELYAIIALRERVFVIEQRCIYLDADGLDPIATHVWASANDAIVAYLRILPPGARFPEASIGRVIVLASERGTGLGRELMRRGIAIANGPIRIGAQAHLQRFYGELGFATISDVYDEDGIPHVDMLRPAGS
ncbi:MAG TPA: GNAT family N-acetyltransferase [Kofleriaceae bacterium]|jgi:ElaA protein